MAVTKTTKRALASDNGAANNTNQTETALSRPDKRTRTTKSSDESTTRENLLVKLPAELRNTIYDLVLLQRGSPEMTLDSTSISMFTRRWNEPALFRTSKQIRQEAMSIYYLGRTWEFCIKYHEMESLYARLARISEEIGGQWPEFTVRVSDGKANKGAALALMRLAYRSTHIRGDSDGDWIVPRMDLMYSTGIAKAREEAREQKREREINQLVERTEQAKCDGMPLDELETKWFGKKETKAGRKGTKSKKGSKSAKSTTNASGTVR